MFVRSQASCKLARMGHLGEGANECAARRVAMAEEERMRGEGEAFYASHIRGRDRWRQMRVNLIGLKAAIDILWVVDDKILENQ